MFSVDFFFKLHSFRITVWETFEFIHFTGLEDCFTGSLKIVLDIIPKISENLKGFVFTVF